MQVTHASTTLHVSHLGHQILPVGVIACLHIARGHGTLFSETLSWDIGALIVVISFIIFNILLHLIHLNCIIVQGDILLVELVRILVILTERVIVDRSKARILMAIVSTKRLTLTFTVSFRRA